MTKALLPALRAAGAGDVVFVGSTAGLVSYEGGASYTAAKHGVHTLAETLRLELNGEPVRVIEIAPGMVRTEEFSLNRLGSAETRPTPSTAGCASRWWPRTSPTASPGRSPGRTT